MTDAPDQNNILEGIGDVAAELEQAEHQVDQLRLARISTFLKAREAGISHSRIGEAAKISGVAVIRLLQRHDKAKSK